MTAAVKNLLRDFELLPMAEKQLFAREIILRSADFDLPPLSDDELILGAEELFLELDRRETEDGKT
jgi:hypothetical protein